MDRSRGPRGTLRRWLRRYLALDLAGLTGGLLAGCAAHELGTGPAAAALAGTLGESLAFYGVAAAREHARRQRASGAPSVLRRLLREFALAEALDLCLLRPLAMACGIRACASPVEGIVLGGFAADLAFYTIAGCSLRALGTPRGGQLEATGGRPGADESPDGAPG